MGNDTPNPSPDFSAIVSELAKSTSPDACMLPSGPEHPDAFLLAVAQELLPVGTAANRLLSEAREIQARSFSARGEERDFLHAIYVRRFTQSYEAGRVFGSGLRRASVPAKTPAGIYAKALLIRTSRTGASGLAKSLADDLLSQPALRSAIWPAEVAQ